MAELHPDTLLICEMFPDIPLKRISDTLYSHNNDIDRSCEELLSHCVLEQEEGHTNTLGLLQAENEEPSFEIVQSKKAMKNRNDGKSSNRNKEKPSRIKGQSHNKELKEIQDLVSLFDDTETIVSLLQLDSAHKEYVQKVFLRNNRNIIRTIIYFLKNYKRHSTSKVKCSDDHSGDKISNGQSATSDIKVLSNRVQGGYSRNVNNKINATENNSPTADTCKCTTAEVTDAMSKVNLNPQGDLVKLNFSSVVERSTKTSYSEQQLEVREDLQNLKKKNRSLCLFPDTFYDMALDFFEYDLVSVLTLIFRLLEDRTQVENEFKLKFDYLIDDIPSGEKETFTEDGFQVYQRKSGKNKTSKPKTRETRDELLKQARKMIQEASSTKRKDLKAYYVTRAREFQEEAAEELSRIQETVIESNLSKSDYKIDLHGLTVSMAVSTVGKVLEEWWDEEIIQRETHGVSSRSHVVLYNPPFTIVTGRGIHSSGGVSKIRGSVYKYLNTNKYIFDEMTSSFTVRGKGK